MYFTPTQYKLHESSLYQAPNLGVAVPRAGEYDRGLRTTMVQISYGGN